MAFAQTSGKSQNQKLSDKCMLILFLQVIELEIGLPTILILNPEA